MIKGDDIMSEERCVCCGDIIPEGMMVCPQCNHQEVKIGTLLQSINATKEQVIQAYRFLGKRFRDEESD